MILSPSVLYTTVPIEQVMQGFAEPQATGATMEIRQGDAILEVEPIDAHRVRSVRLISPRPQDYLDPQRAHGTILAWHFRDSPAGWS